MDVINRIVELYEDTTIKIRPDVIRALNDSLSEETDPHAYGQLERILENIKTAEKKQKPVCGDTGTPTFFVKRNVGLSELYIKATEIATERTILRPSTYDPLTGENIGNFPEIHFEEWPENYTKISLLLKGGGSENAGRILTPEYRNLDGARKEILKAVFEMQGRSCPPGIVGICIGSSQDYGLKRAKEMLLRDVYDENENNILAEFEENLKDDINSLGIGPMGVGGKTTVLGVKACSEPRHAASYFVSLSCLCWAGRKGEIRI